MAVDLRCPNCEDNLGKDVENSVHAGCGTCGHSFYNERGYRDENDEEEKEFINKHKNKGTRLVTLPNGRILGRTRVININKKLW